MALDDQGRRRPSVRPGRQTRLKVKKALKVPSPISSIHPHGTKMTIAIKIAKTNISWNFALLDL